MRISGHKKRAKGDLAIISSPHHAVGSLLSLVGRLYLTKGKDSKAVGVALRSLIITPKFAASKTN